MFFRAKKLTPIDPSSLEKLGQGVVNLSKYTEDEFGQVAKAFQQIDPETILYAPPPKPRRGTIVYADGTHWNPGHGEGPYYFNGTTWVPMFEYKALTIVKQIFTSSGTYTPTAGMVYCIAEGVGSGGGGGGAQGAASQTYYGGGGGSGAYSRLLASAAMIGVSQVVTIGAAGVGGSGGLNNATSGGNCSLGGLLVMGGGAFGTVGSGSLVGTGGPGGVAGGSGDIVAAGMPGETGIYLSANIATLLHGGGNGGSSFFGGGGLGGVCGGGAFANGGNASNFGSGGGGAAVNNAPGSNPTGGNGSKGMISVTEFCFA